MPIQSIGNARRGESSQTSLRIGLLNNMPDGALKATERQFLSLLDSAAVGVTVYPSLYALPDIPRSEFGLRHIGRFYSGIDDFWSSQLDALIVTGAEPRVTDLQDEPYWGSLTKVLDWAEHNTHSVILSCLAAHAAVLHTDGIGRRRFAEKRFGVFECARESDHPLTAGVPATFQVPHSRWHDTPGDALADYGYRVLSRGKDGTVDLFAKQRKSLFLFFQGHPEYAADTLLLEYRRDVASYLRRERATYPAMPEGYFGRDAELEFTAFRERALSNRSDELLADFPVAHLEEAVANTWRPMAQQVYGNWLAHLCTQKRRSRDRQLRNSFRRRIG